MQVCVVLLQLASWLELCHQTRFAQRNIKPSNVLQLTGSGNITVVDFGCSARIGALCQLWASHHVALFQRYFDSSGAELAFERLASAEWKSILCSDSKCVHACSCFDVSASRLAAVFVSSLQQRVLTLFGAAGTKTALSKSIRYAPPEAIQAAEQNHTTVPSDPAADIWSFGAVTFELATGKSMFAGFHSAADVRAALAGRAPFPWESAVGTSATGCFSKIGGLRRVLKLSLIHI